MNILLLGASGLIGSALLPTLLAQGYCVTTLSRKATEDNTRQGICQLQADISRWIEPQDWQAALAGIDVVINAVGIFAENAQQSFATLHIAMPTALFAACEQYGVQHVIQISALGADTQAATEYWRSKGEADAALMASQLDWAIVRPSLIYSPNGRSCQQFLSMASWPLLPDLRNSAAVQPVHLDDVIAAILALLAAPNQQVVNLVGPSAMSLSQWLAVLRAGMGLPATKSLPVYGWMQDIAAAAAQYMPDSLFSPASLAMLRIGNHADQAPLAQLLGRPLKAAAPDVSDTGLAARAQLAWLMPILRYSMAAVWLITAMVSAINWPQSLALLAQLGIAESLQWPLLIGAIGCDLALGVSCLMSRWRSWKLQIALVLLYSTLISWGLSEYLLHPFGPILKNLPILAVLLLLDQCEQANGKR
ncbi:SDR family oxidoreductase [Chitinibacter sp. GC72]|uniref:SDR family oxidoreductase n=1 Tax=Chitinibacter sp. GC72 TaxID=1526917 RepID=UPI0012FCC8AA|nr:SDR family oxidoreductase [Chitinibacter sp. GC72]